MIVFFYKKCYYTIGNDNVHKTSGSKAAACFKGEYHMDFQTQIPDQDPINIRPHPPQENGMATAALITGIVGGLSTFVLPFYLPCVLGGVSIVLAFLSKGELARLSARARSGFIISLCSLLLNAALLAGCFYLVFHVPEFQEAFEQAYEQLYGESFYDSFGSDPLNPSGK